MSRKPKNQPAPKPPATTESTPTVAPGAEQSETDNRLHMDIVLSGRFADALEMRAKAKGVTRDEYAVTILEAALASYVK